MKEPIFPDFEIKEKEYKFAQDELIVYSYVRVKGDDDKWYKQLVVSTYAYTVSIENFPVKIYENAIKSHIESCYTVLNLSVINKYHRDIMENCYSRPLIPLKSLIYDEECQTDEKERLREIQKSFYKEATEE